MKQMIRPLIAAVALIATPMLAQASTPIPSIANAEWNQYRDEYTQSPLCEKDEIPLWTCENNKRVFSLCSSQVMTRTSGYMQYRAARNGKIVFIYPDTRKPPLGYFSYKTFAAGDASVEFVNSGYHYSLLDPLRGDSSLLVSTDAPSGKTTEIKCGGNQTLQVNYTMRLMYDSGIWSGD